MTDTTTIQPTIVALLLDESSSMQPIRDNTLSALDEYLATLKKGDGAENIKFTLTTFSTLRIVTIFSAKPVTEVTMAEIDTAYQPNGSTPLIDAAMDLINATEEVAQPGQPVIIAIQTDGQENSSSRFKTDDLKAKIERKTADGWRFVFLGAGVDAYAQAATYGIRQGAAMSYGKDANRTASAFRSLAQNTRLYASGATGQSIGGMDFTEAQLSDAADDSYGKPPEPKTWASDS